MLPVAAYIDADIANDKPSFYQGTVTSPSRFFCSCSKPKRKSLKQLGDLTEIICGHFDEKWGYHRTQG